MSDQPTQPQEPETVQALRASLASAEQLIDRLQAEIRGRQPQEQPLVSEEMVEAAEAAMNEYPPESWMGNDQLRAGIEAAIAHSSSVPGEGQPSRDELALRLADAYAIIDHVTPRDPDDGLPDGYAIDEKGIHLDGNLCSAIEFAFTGGMGCLDLAEFEEQRHASLAKFAAHLGIDAATEKPETSPEDDGSVIIGGRKVSPDEYRRFKSWLQEQDATSTEETG